MSVKFYETLTNTAINHIKAYESPDPFNPVRTLPYRSPDCIHRLHPAESVPESFRGPLYQEQYCKALKFLGAVMESCRYEITEMLVDAERRTVATRLTGIFDLKSVGDAEAEKGYTAEYMYVTEMDESGEKIIRMEEYLDVQRMLGHVLEKAEKYAALNDSSAE